VLRASTRRSIAAALALFAGGGAAVHAAAPVRLEVRAPAELAALLPEIEQIRAAGFDRALALAGLDDPGGPIVVVLAAAGSPAERGAPPWISGWADGRAGVVVLLPSRVDRYPARGLAPLLRHEVAHVLVARAAAGQPVPRWFDEGIAMAAGRELELGDRARVALAVLTDASLPIARLDRAFAGGESEVQAAYALAGDLVRELEKRYGDDVTGRILARLARGERFRDAFAGATGTRLAQFESDYWSRRTLWDRWIPILSSSVLVWSGVALLVVAASRRKRQRAEELRRRWAAEEAAALAADSERRPEDLLN